MSIYNGNVPERTIILMRGTMNDMDKLLKQALEEIVKEDYENRPQDIPKHRFSAEFRRKMKQAVRMMEAPGKNDAGRSGNSLLELYHPIRSKRKWAVLALLILMLIGGSAIAAEPIRHWLKGFRVEQNSDHVRIQNGTEQTSAGENRGEFRRYRLGEVPEGYVLEQEKFEEGFQRYSIRYVNGSNNVLSLKQTWQEKEYPENLTSGAEPLEEVEMNGFTGYYVKDNGVGSLIISNGIYKLVLDGTFSKEELMGLVEKLELVDEPVH